MAADFAAGCVGGCAGVIVGHPLDTVKVHLQTQDAKQPKYRGTLHCLRTLVVKEGVRGLYRGMSSPLAGVAGINAIVFGVYGNTQRHLSDPDSLMSHFLAGSVAGLVQSGVCSPMELAKTRVQVSGDNIGPLQCLKNIYKYEGVKGVFRGLGITVAREVPAFGSYFLTYEMLTRTEDSTRASTATMLFAGGVAGCVSWVIVYPVDVIKSRMQVDGMSGTPKYKNSWDCVKKGIASEGYAFLGRGLMPTLVRAFPTNAACFTAVTWSMRLLSGEVNLEVVPSDEPSEASLWTRCENAVSSLRTGEAPAALT